MTISTSSKKAVFIKKKKQQLLQFYYRLVARQEDRYFNLQTGRCLKSSSLTVIKAKYVNHRYHILAHKSAWLTWAIKLINQVKKSTVALKAKYSHDIITTERDRQQAIPTKLRYQVWRQYCQGRIEMPCFCCHRTIYFDDWHCGHILSRREGGKLKSANMRPVCKECNLKMGVLHMYEYIFRKNLPGKDSLDLNNPVVRLYKEASRVLRQTLCCLKSLRTNGYLTGAEIKFYLHSLLSSRKTLTERMNLMINVQQFTQDLIS